MLFLLLLSIMSSSTPMAWGEPQHGRLPSAQQTQAEQDAAERAKIEKDMAKKANEERQADLQRDTEKLVVLANELKQYVQKSNKDVLSLEVVKKAEEIEKLAHSVKEKMKGSN